MMKVKDIVKKHEGKRENLLQMLHEIQDDNPRNYLTCDSLQALSEEMHIPVSEIKSTASFYTMFSFKPRGKYIIRVCESPPCHIMGSKTIFKAILNELSIQKGDTTNDGLFTLEETSCLGVCSVAPAMMINHTVYGHLTEQKVKDILQQIKKEEGRLDE